MRIMGVKCWLHKFVLHKFILCHMLEMHKMLEHKFIHRPVLMSLHKFFMHTKMSLYGIYS